MSLAEWMQIGRNATLYIALGARSISCGLSIDGRVDARWQLPTLLDIPIDYERAITPKQALIDAIGHTAAALLAQRDAAAADWITPRTVRVVIGDCWLAFTTLPWQHGVSTAASALANARQQLHAAGYALEANDSVRLEDGAFGQPRMAFGYSAQLLGALNQLAANINSRLDSVAPLSASARAVVRRDHNLKSSALAIVADGLLLIAIGKVSVDKLSVLLQSTDDDDSLPALTAHWQRMQLRDPQLESIMPLPVLNLSTINPQTYSGASGLHLLNLQCLTINPEVPAILRFAQRAATLFRQQRSELDLMPPAHRITLLQFSVLVAALLLSGGLTLHAWQTNQRLQIAQTNTRAMTPPLPPVPIRKSRSREELAQVQAINNAIRELNLPVGALLRALQPPRDIGVAVLSVDTAKTDGGNRSAVIKIVAEARTSDDMARYVSYVAERPPFTNAYLVRHEIVEASPDKPYRFTLDASWGESQ